MWRMQMFVCARHKDQTGSTIITPLFKRRLDLFIFWFFVFIVQYLCSLLIFNCGCVRRLFPIFPSMYNCRGCSSLFILRRLHLQRHLLKCVCTVYAVHFGCISEGLGGAPKGPVNTFINLFTGYFTTKKDVYAHSNTCYAVDNIVKWSQ